MRARATQNQNECINSMVWVRCPKHKHHGVKVVRGAVASAVCHFHSGATSQLRIMERLSIPGGALTRLASNAKDNKRKRKSDLQATDKEKKRRQGEQLLPTHREEALRDAEGDTYDAVGFLTDSRNLLWLNVYRRATIRHLINVKINGFRTFKSFFL